MIRYNFTGRKRLPVAWVVTNCKTHSRRELYVQELSKYIPITILGGCGTHRCLPGEACFQTLNVTHKFYLSFENSLYKDYVTEKLYRVMRYDLVPVVLGLANYSALLPPKSYIDIRDFASPKQLAEYLHVLNGNDTLYNEYFRWKRKWRSGNKRAPFLCQLCQMLNENEGKMNIHEDVEAWLLEGCVDPVEYYAGHVPQAMMKSFELIPEHSCRRPGKQYTVPTPWT